MVYQHILVSGIFEQIQATAFSNLFCVDLEHNEQGPGVCGDFICSGTSVGDKSNRFALETALDFSILGRKVEFKHDKAAERTGRLFLEYEQTSDDWQTKKKSGHEKSILEGNILVITTQGECFVFNKLSYNALVARTLYKRTTTHRKNGNRPESYTQGRLVSVSAARECASYVYQM